MIGGRFRHFTEHLADVLCVLDAATQQMEHVNPSYEKIVIDNSKLKSAECSEDH